MAKKRFQKGKYVYFVKDGDDWIVKGHSTYNMIGRIHKNSSNKHWRFIPNPREVLYLTILKDIVRFMKRLD